MAAGRGQAWVAGALTLAALAGCGGGDDGAPAGGGGERPADVRDRGTGEAARTPRGPLVVYDATVRGKRAHLRVERDGRTVVSGQSSAGARCTGRERRFRMTGGELSSVDAQLARVPRARPRTRIIEADRRALEVRIKTADGMLHYAGRGSMPKPILSLFVFLNGTVDGHCWGRP